MDPGRAADRAARMTERRFASQADAERHDRVAWLEVPPADRVALVWRLSVELWRWRGESADESGLCRSVAVVHRP